MARANSSVSGSWTEAAASTRFWAVKRFLPGAFSTSKVCCQARFRSRVYCGCRDKNVQSAKVRRSVGSRKRRVEPFCLTYTFKQLQDFRQGQVGGRQPQSLGISLQVLHRHTTTAAVVVAEAQVQRLDLRVIQPTGTIFFIQGLKGIG